MMMIMVFCVSGGPIFCEEKEKEEEEEKKKKKTKKKDELAWQSITFQTWALFSNSHFHFAFQQLSSLQ
jgi:hypothetical protein